MLGNQYVEYIKVQATLEDPKPDRQQNEHKDPYQDLREWMGMIEACLIQAIVDYHLSQKLK